MSEFIEKQHDAQYTYVEGTGHGDDQEIFLCWCGWVKIGVDRKAKREARKHNEIVSLIPRPKPTWRSAARGERWDAWRDLRFERSKKRRWRMEYRDMLYDGGMSDFERFYYTKLGAILSSFGERHIRAWDGKAELFDQRAK